jgi:hypothetical protein
MCLRERRLKIAGLMGTVREVENRFQQRRSEALPLMGRRDADEGEIPVWHAWMQVIQGPEASA